MTLIEKHSLITGALCFVVLACLLPVLRADDLESRAIVGFHQAGASSSKGEQNLFFDFFVIREMPNPRFNVWGNVRIASAPQQITTSLSQFSIAAEAGKVKVNELAQSAEFQSGIEFRIKCWHPGETENTCDSKHKDKADGHAMKPRRYFGLVAYFGAQGLLDDPVKKLTVFDVPVPGSLQRDRFLKTFPSIPATAQYAGFVPPDRERFYRQYGAGIRFTTHRGNIAPPATYTATFGQDELITGGRFRSVVGRFDVFYPLPLTKGDTKADFIYLFGTANLRLSAAKNLDAFVLNPSAATAAASPNMAVVTIASTRDTYRIGVGIDVISMIQSFKPKLPAGAGTGNQ